MEMVALLRPEASESRLIYAWKASRIRKLETKKGRALIEHSLFLNY